MSLNFVGLINRKYKKVFGKVRFVGVRSIPKSEDHFRSSVLISVGYGLLSSSEIEAGRRVLRKLIGKSRRIRVLVRVYPYIPLMGKPSEVRMGRGKGSRIRKWVSFIKPGKVIYELKNIPFRRALRVLKKSSEKLSVSTRTLFLNKMKSKKYLL
jgi:large subunit ribosomal protein L16